jgi:cell cycle checkpoint control protein RAD9A
VEKSAERCELSIVEGSLDEGNDDEEHDSLESKLIIKLYCKHGGLFTHNGQPSWLLYGDIGDMVIGIVKTHRLLMLTPTALMAPTCPDSPNESKVTIGPRALKDVIDHFSVNKGGKSDPQLVWTFADGELTLRSSDSIAGNRGRTTPPGRYESC